MDINLNQHDPIEIIDAQIELFNEELHQKQYIFKDLLQQVSDIINKPNHQQFGDLSTLITDL